jgi:hypothetical protein
MNLVLAFYLLNQSLDATHTLVNHTHLDPTSLTEITTVDTTWLFQAEMFQSANHSFMTFSRDSRKAWFATSGYSLIQATVPEVEK